MEAIVTPEEMAAIDAAAPEPVEVLIGRAGWAVAREAFDMLGGAYGRRVVVVAGKGNNGADGREAARRLERRGVRCRVIDAASVAASEGAVLPAADLVIDAAYGTGFRGEHRPARLADPATPVLAVDLPSGVSGLTGEALGAPWPADRTVTFAALKPGLILGAGAELAGEVNVADIGLDVTGARAHRLDSSDLRGLLPDPPRDLHKWRHAVRVIAGSPGMTGAAHLTVRAAQRSGATYVRLSTPGSGRDDLAATPTEAVGTPLPALGWADDVLSGADRFAAVAVGPGLGRSADCDEEVRRLVAGGVRPIVVDGDGIRALGGADRVAEVIRSRPHGAGPVVITPHDGEFESLIGRGPGPDRFAAVRDVSARTGATVLLKGPTTLVASPDGTVLASTAGDHRLATAGTGDVLTGIISSLLARGVGAREAAAAGAVLHGRAGALASRWGLVAGDLIDHLPTALTEAFGG